MSYDQEVMKHERGPMNRTLTIEDRERDLLGSRLQTVNTPEGLEHLKNKVIFGDLFKCVDLLPDHFVDLLIIDPPYNLDKIYNGNSFRKMQPNEYTAWVESWMVKLVRTVKPSGSIYVCCDWQSSFAIYEALSKYFIVKNRITWEREKGRGSRTNWKNCSEDIWYAVASKEATFHPDRVMTKRKVLAPYRHANGAPKDWNETEAGNYRLTHPSNLWTDITVPFWSMPENTDHPAQKPEKLIAKLILASSNPSDLVFDPFLGSGTTAVVAKKLGRMYCGIEIDHEYCLLAEKRLELASRSSAIQGYDGETFWERNSLGEQRRLSRGSAVGRDAAKHTQESLL
jgi:site-specific DNA-methyltransferase (adenine-specific)